MKPINNQRIKAIDILRGMTVAGMILVNDPGSWEHIYPPLEHVKWNGLSPTDLVFPFFMFIMGISIYISLSKNNFKCSSATIGKIVKRTMLLYLIGFGLAWLSCSIRTFYSPGINSTATGEGLLRAISNFHEVRILGVIPRLAICYGCVALLVLVLKHKYIPILVAGLLTAYYLVLLTGNGFAYNETNILSQVDFAILGKSHMYIDNGIEPEGILSTLPAIAHVLVGFYIGMILIKNKDIDSKIEFLFVAGAILCIAGFLLRYGCPINKKIWSPTFVLLTCGIASSLLALLIWVIDKRAYSKWAVFFESFGVNPLFLYILSDILAIAMGCIPICINGKCTSITTFSFDYLCRITNELNASAIYAILFVGVNWLLGYVLFRKKIIIKL